MKKILDFEIPSVTYTPPVDCKLIIMQNAELEIQNSLWEHFVRIKNSTYVEDVDFIDNNMWESFKNLTIYKIRKEELLPNPMKVVKQYIEDDYFLFLIIDTSKIRNYVNYGGETFRHELLIYGYDEELQYVYASDYFDYKKYRKERILLRDLEDGIQSALNIEDDYLNGVYCLKATTIPEYHRRVKKRYDWHKFYGDLMSLIKPARESNNYGFYFFEMLKDRIRTPTEVVRIRPYHFIIVHSTFMKQRMIYLKKCGIEWPQICWDRIEYIISKGRYLEIFHAKSIVKDTDIDAEKEIMVLNEIMLEYFEFIKEMISYIEDNIFMDAGT